MSGFAPTVIAAAISLSLLGQKHGTNAGYVGKLLGGLQVVGTCQHMVVWGCMEMISGVCVYGVESA